MATYIKKYKPVTPGRRSYSVLITEETKKEEPYAPLLEPLRKTGGRNNLGRITVKYRGGGEKRFYRIIDFKRTDKLNIPAKVVSIQYDPNRTANIALLLYKDGEYRYIIAPEGLSVGDEVIAGEDVPLKIGNAMPLAKIPVGIEIHNIQMAPNTRGRLVRAAGGAAQILAKEGDYAYVKLPSGEIRLISLKCYATIGRVSNSEHINIDLGKAGRKRHMGRRPRTRTVAMNPRDHPMGGGEGRSSGGRPSCSPKGIYTKGKKTRKKHKPSDKFIVKRRR